MLIQRQEEESSHRTGKCENCGLLFQTMNFPEQQQQQRIPLCTSRKTNAQQRPPLCNLTCKAVVIRWQILARI